MTEAMDTMESTIQRARMALGAGIPEEEVAARIQEDLSPEIAFLAIRAAKVLLAGEVQDETCSEIPDI